MVKIIWLDFPPVSIFCLEIARGLCPWLVTPLVRLRSTHPVKARVGRVLGVEINWDGAEYQYHDIAKLPSDSQWFLVMADGTSPRFGRYVKERSRPRNTGWVFALVETAKSFIRSKLGSEMSYVWMLRAPMRGSWMLMRSCGAVSLPSCVAMPRGSHRVVS